MLPDLTPPQLALAEYMSGLSEEAYFAGWMAGLEVALWEVLLGSRSEYGGLVATEDHRSELRRLSDACGGWIVFDRVLGETWMPTVDWERRFAERDSDDGG